MPTLGRRASVLLAVWFAGAAALSLAPRVRDLLRREPSRQARILSDYADIGELLLHRLPGTGTGPVSTFRLPALGFLSAAAVSHGRLSWEAFGLISQTAAVLLLAALLALLCAGGAPWGAALAGLAFLAGPRGAGDLDLAHSSVPVLLAAGLLVWRARALSWTTAVLLAAGIGVSLLHRSTLAFLGPLLAVFELLRRGRSGWRQALFLALAPCLFLLPWIGLNWSLHGRLIPFEHGAASSNIVVGALGLEETVEGEAAALTGDSSAGVLGWAARHVLSHPWQYLAACGRRLWLLFTWHPVLFLLGAVGWRLGRGRRELDALGLLVLYFIGIHCLMAISPLYFQPLWPLLLALAVGGASRAFAARAPALSQGWALAGQAVLCAGLGLAVLLAGALSWSMLAYRSAAGLSGEDLARRYDEELRQSPEHAWLYGQRGESRLAQDDLSGAEADLSRAADLAPQERRTRLMLAWAQWLRGKPAALRDWDFAPLAPAGEDLARTAWSADIEARVLRAYAAAAAGRLDAARGELAAARAIEEAMVVVRGGRTRKSLEVREELKRASGALAVAAASGLLGRRPLPARLALLPLLAEAFPGRALPFAGPWLEEAVAADPRRAEAVLRRLPPSLLEGPALRRLSGACVGLADQRASRRLLDLLARFHARAPAVPLAAAAAAARAGARGEALRELERAESLGLDEEGTLAAAFLYAELGAPEPARRLYGRLSRVRPRDAAQALRLAGLEHAIGNPIAALRYLNEARDSSLDREGRLAAASLYIELGRLAPARDLLGPLAKAEPPDPRAALALAKLEMSAGEREAALRELGQAERADDADLVCAAATLYAELGEPARARRLAEGLSRRPGLDAASALKVASLAAAQGWTEAALRCLGRVTAAPASSDQVLSAALLYQRLGRQGESLRLLDKLAAAEPGNARCLSARGVAKALLGRQEEALADFRGAIRADPRLLESYLSLGSLLAMRGRRDEAAAAYEQGLAVKEPRDVNVAPMLRKALAAGRAKPAQ